MSEEKQNVPKLRFPGFTDPWEQRKLGETLSIMGGNAWKSSEYTYSGKYLVVTIANVKGRNYIDDSFGNRINTSNLENYLLHENDILVSLTGNVGRVSKMTATPAVLNQRVAKILIDSDVANGEFIYQILSSTKFESSMISKGQGGAQANISNNNVLDYAAYMPSKIEEQTKIGTFFKQFDHLITLHQRKLDHLKELKKGLLQQMFV